MPKIHPSSIVMEGAVLADDVVVGPLCYVGPHVKIGAGTRLIAQCNIDGYTTLGEKNIVYPFAALGQLPQDHAADPNAVSYLNIGDRNTFREGCAIHVATGEGNATTIGSDNLFMAHSHVGHNGKVGNHVTFVNSAMVGGYAEVKDFAILSGLVAIHQFVRIGRFAIVSGGSVFSKDIPPFVMVEGRNGSAKMINKIGLQRAGFSAETITILRHLYMIYYRSDLIPSMALEKIKTDLPQIPEVKEFIEFCESSSRGVISAKVNGHRD